MCCVAKTCLCSEKVLRELILDCIDFHTRSLLSIWSFRVFITVGCQLFLSFMIPYLLAQWLWQLLCLLLSSCVCYMGLEHRGELAIPSCMWHVTRHYSEHSLPSWGKNSKAVRYSGISEELYFSHAELPFHHHNQIQGFLLYALLN